MKLSFPRCSSIVPPYRVQKLHKLDRSDGDAPCAPSESRGLCALTMGVLELEEPCTLLLAVYLTLSQTASFFRARRSAGYDPEHRARKVF